MVLAPNQRFNPNQDPNKILEQDEAQGVYTSIQKRIMLSVTNGLGYDPSAERPESINLEARNSENRRYEEKIKAMNRLTGVETVVTLAENVAKTLGVDFNVACDFFTGNFSIGNSPQLSYGEFSGTSRKSQEPKTPYNTEDGLYDSII